MLGFREAATLRNNRKFRWTVSHCILAFNKSHQTIGDWRYELFIDELIFSLDCCSYRIF